MNQGGRSMLCLLKIQWNYRCLLQDPSFQGVLFAGKCCGRFPKEISIQLELTRAFGIEQVSICVSCISPSPTFKSVAAARALYWRFLAGRLAEPCITTPQTEYWEGGKIGYVRIQ